MQAGKRKISQKMLLILVMAGVLMISAVAWFALANRSRSGDLEIEMPPIIYIKDDNLREMTSFDLDGLQINKTYNALFCVAPAYEGTVKDFDLGVIYTENIGMVIKLYPVQKITEKPESTEYEKRTLEGQDCYFNYDSAKSPIYKGEFEEYTATGKDIFTKLNNTKAYRFYVLQVTWKENISEAELEKETDVVYIVTQGGTKRGA